MSLDSSTPGEVLVWVSGSRVTKAAYAGVVDPCGIAHTSSRLAPSALTSGRATLVGTETLDVRSARLTIRLGTTTGTATLTLDPGAGCTNSTTSYNLRKTSVVPAPPTPPTVDGTYRSGDSIATVANGRLTRLRVPTRIRCVSADGTETVLPGALDIVGGPNEGLLVIDDGGSNGASGSFVAIRSGQTILGLSNATVNVTGDFTRPPVGAGTVHVQYNVTGDGPGGSLCQADGSTTLSG